MTIQKIAAISALAAASVFAQQTTPATGQHRVGPRGRMQKMAQELNLSADQKAQAREIFRSAFQSAQPLRQQMRDARKQLQTDVKSGASEDLLAKDGSQVGAIAGQMAVSRAKAFEQFYSILTPDQKAKLETLKGQAHRFGARSRS